MSARKEYELMFTLKANMESAFQGAFKQSGSIISELQKKVNAAKTAMGDISAYQKLEGAIKKNTEDIEKNKTAYEKAKSTLDANKTKLAQHSDQLAKAQVVEEQQKKKLDALQSSYDKTTTKTEKQKAALEKQKKAYEQAAKATEELRARTESEAAAVNKSENNLTNKERALNNSTKALRENQNALKAQEERLKEAGVDTQNLTKENERLSASYNDLRAKQNSLGSINREITETRAALSSAQSEFMMAYSQAKMLGSAVYNFTLAPTMAFESQMSTVQAISNATAAEKKMLEKAAKEAGLTTKFTATESGQAFEYMSLAGWKADQMQAGLKGILNLSAAGKTDLATTSDIVTDALTAFKMKPSDSNRFADIMAATMANSNTDISKMGESFKYAAPLSGAYKFSAEDTALILGLEANAGIKGRTGGTSARTLFTKLSNDITLTGADGNDITVKVSDANGKMRDLRSIIDDLRAAFKGMSAESKNAINNDLIATAQQLGISLNDTNGQAKTAAVLYGEISDELNNMTEAGQIQEAEAIAGKTAMSGLLAIMNASEEEYQNLADAIYNCDGAAEKMANTMLNNLEGDITLAKSAAEGFGIALGETLTPSLREAVQWGTGVLQSMAEFAEKNPGLVKTLAATSAGLVTANMASLGLKLGMTAVKLPMLTAAKALAQFGIAKVEAGNITSLSGAVKVLGTGLSGILSPAGVAVAAITALAVAGFVAYRAAKRQKEEWRNYGEAVAEARAKFDEAAESSKQATQMRDRYKELGKAMSDGTLSAEGLKDAQEERKGIEEWFIDHYGEFCDAEAAKRGEMEKSMDMAVNYAESMRNLTESEFEMKLSQLTADLPEYEKDIAKNQAEIDKLSAQKLQDMADATILNNISAAVTRNGGEWGVEADALADQIQNDQIRKNVLGQKTGDYAKGVARALESGVSEKNKKIAEYQTAINNSTASREQQRVYAQEKVEKVLGSTYEEATKKAEAFRTALGEIEKAGGISDATLNSLEEYIPGISTAEDKTTALNGAVQDFDKKLESAKNTAKEYSVELNGARRGEESFIKTSEKLSIVENALLKIRSGAELTEDELKALESIIPGIGAQVDKITPLETCFNNLKSKINDVSGNIRNLIAALDGLPEEKEIKIKQIVSTLPGVSLTQGAELQKAGGSSAGSTWTYTHRAVGVRYSPEDIYIAGENGPELITNGRGSTVFTALETGRIFQNIAKFSEMSAPPRFSAPFVDERASNSENKYEISVNFSPTINGGNTDEIADILDKVKGELISEMMRKLDERAVDTRRRQFV